MLCVVYNISNMRLFIISNRLPVKVTRSSDGKFVFSRSEGGLATGLKSLDVDCEKHWIGWPGVCVEQKTEKDDICSQLEKNNGNYIQSYSITLVKRCKDLLSHIGRIFPYKNVFLSVSLTQQLTNHEL